MNAKEIRSQKVLTDEMLQELISLIHPLIIEKVGEGSLKVVQITDMSGLQTSHYMMMDLITEDNKEAIAALPEDRIVPVGPVYTITYASTHGTAPQSKAVRSMADKKYTLTEEDLPEMSVEGYVFGGWLLDGKVLSVGDSIDKNVTLGAIWISDFQLSYKVLPEGIEVLGIPEDHSVTPTEEGLYEIQEEDIPENVVAEGYVLEGYYIGDNKLEVGEEIVGEDTEITVKFVEE